MQTAMFLSGAVVGLFLGALLWEYLVAGPDYLNARRREYRLNDRVRAWQRMYLYAEGSRVATSETLFEATHPEADTFSKKAPELRSVQ